MPRLLDIIDTRNILGEGPHWNAADGRLWWTDIQARQLFRLDPRTRAIDMIDMPERVGSFTFCEGKNDTLLVAFETGLGFYHLASGRVEWLARPELGSGRRFNDGRVDRQGRFWVATMVEDQARAARGSAGLFCLDLDGRFAQHEAGVQIGNGLCFNPAGDILYFADSVARTIHAYDLLAQTGQISGRRLFAQVAHGHPDGAAIDSAGHMWSARWGAGCVVRHAPDGSIAHSLAVPVAQPTCVVFGGADLRLIFVTSAQDGQDPAARAADPKAGALLMYESDIAGLPERRYAGRDRAGERA
jgi:sugar lactone lactonase YvrE